MGGRNVTTLSMKYQIVIPKNVREQMGLKKGVKVYVRPIDRDHAMIVKESIDPVEELRGLGKEVWDALGGADAYLKRERESWDD